MYDKIPVLELDIKNKKYISGNRIKGSLILNNFTYIGIKKLEILLIGEIENKFNYNNIIIFDETNNIFKTILNYDFIKNKFNTKNKIYNLLLNPCQKHIDVDISIPILNLPQTYKCNNFIIKYKIISVFSYINISNNVKNIIKTEKEIEIIPLIYTFIDKYLIPRILKSENKINNKIINGSFIYLIFLSFISYTPGDFLDLQLKLNNETNINSYIISINILIKKQLIITHFLDYVADNKIIVSYNKKIIHNKNNDTIIKINDLQIPYNCGYSIFSNSTDNLFEVKYILSINISLYKDKNKIHLNNISVPIIVGSYRNDKNNIEKGPILPKYNAKKEILLQLIKKVKLN